MKTRLIISKLAAASMAIAAVCPATPVAAEVKSQASGKIQLEIDPGSANFNIDDVEKNIRRMAEGMNLPEDQKAGLDQALKELRDSVKPGPDGTPKKFSWKWEFNTDGPQLRQPLRKKSADGADAPKGYQQWLERMKDRVQGGKGEEELKDLFKKFFGGEGDMQKMMEEMMEQFGPGGGQSPDGQKKFFFRFGPNGLEQGKNDENGDGFPWKQFGGHDHGPDHVYDPDKAPRDSKYGRATLAEFRGAVKDARKSTVSILREGRAISLGVVVSANGYVLTKASELGKGDIECEFMDGKILAGKVADRLDAYDLALVKIDGVTDLTAANFKVGDLPVGAMLAAAGIDEDPVSVGVVSVLPRNLDDGQKGFVGLRLDSAKDGSGVMIIEVVDGSPAEKAKLEKGDVVLSVDGEAVKHPHELMKRVGAHKPGETVKLRIKQDAAEEDVEVTLASRADYPQNPISALDPTARMGTDLSSKSSGFPNALQCDLGVNANQCGGPVVDIDGNLVGVVIARAGRTSTYVIPAKTVKDLLAEVAQGKLAFAKDPALLEREVRRYEAELKKAEETLKGVQDKLKEAREAHDKVKK